MDKTHLADEQMDLDLHLDMCLVPVFHCTMAYEMGPNDRNNYCFAFELDFEHLILANFQDNFIGIVECISFAARSNSTFSIRFFRV